MSKQRPFPTSTIGAAPRLPPAVLERDELRILRRSLRDAEERSHLLALHLRAAEHRDLHAVARRDVARRCRRGSRACRGCPASSPSGARASWPSAIALAAAPARVASRRVADEDRRRVERRAALLFGRRRLEVRVLPRAGGEADRDRLDVSLAVSVAGVEREPPTPMRPRLPRGERARRAAAPPRGRSTLPMPTSSTRAGRRSPPREMQRLVAAAAEVAPLERRARARRRASRRAP